MQTSKSLMAISFILLGSGAAWADSDNATRATQGKGQPMAVAGAPQMGGGMMGGDMMPGMMQMMMKMHAGGGMSADGMMDRDMMGMMNRAGMTPDELGAKMKEYDADANGTLDLSEFESLNAALLRAQTVDRFQYLDADGDGQITEAEITAASGRMAAMAAGGMGAMGAMGGPGINGMGASGTGSPSGMGGMNGMNAADNMGNMGGNAGQTMPMQPKTDGN